MNAVFLDTSFLIAVVRTRDQHHAAAMQWRKVLNGPYVTTDYVLVEFMDASAAMPMRSRGTEALRIIREDPDVRIIQASASLFDNGVDIFRRHADKAWGLTDCISFVVMRREGITDALSSDRDFEQAGFRALMRISPSEHPGL